MKRRKFITLLSGAAAWPLAVQAQQSGKVIRIGFFGPSLTSPPPIALYQAFLARLRELGFSEGQNLDIEYRGMQSLARPGGNITGVVFQQIELAQKQVELLTQAFPSKTRLDYSLRRAIDGPVQRGGSYGKIIELAGSSTEARKSTIRCSSSPVPSLPRIGPGWLNLRSHIACRACRMAKILIRGSCRFDRGIELR